MLDPVTLEVVRHRLDSIADEMEVVLLKSAHSSIVKEGLDASSALFDLQGETVAQAAAIPIHLGCLIPAVRAVLGRFPPERMRPGDVYIINDPYSGGTHLPDITLVLPVFYGGRPVALGCTMAHHQDVGGKTPGSIPPDATEIFQEGLRIPPLKLYDAGEPVEPVWEMVRANVRIPEVVLGDLRAQVAAGRVALRRITELMEEMGPETVLDAMQALLEQAEAMTRATLRGIPDGTYTFVDYLDCDGIDMDRPVRIQATVTIRGDECLVDFAGTSPQVRGPFNATPSSALSAVYYMVRAVTDPSIPNNSGCYRPVRVHLPEGSLVNPRPPAPVNSRTATIKRLADVLHGAMVQAIPHRLPAASSGELLVMAMGGVDPLTGRPYVTSELLAGGMGARPSADGIDAIETDVTNCMNIPAEALEMDFPIRIRAWRLRTDSGGAGRYRGGLGVEKVFEVSRGRATFSYRGERHTTRPWGVLGGRAGEGAWASLVRRDGTTTPVPSKAILALEEGDRLVVATAGGGGYGDPLERPPEAVLQDVVDGRVSPRQAREVYGVVVRGDPPYLDAGATARLRRRLRRGGPPALFDRGDSLASAGEGGA